MNKIIEAYIKFIINLGCCVTEFQVDFQIIYQCYRLELVTNWIANNLL